MSPRRRAHRCDCDCHAGIAVHLTLTCDCGRPVTPPAEGHRECPPRRDVCPPPPVEPQPGTADVPQDSPPPPPRTSDVPPWKEGRPPAGDPGEVPWFRGKIRDILRNGPTMGPRKDEYLPFLVVRSASGDRGGRPLAGVFWESPDIGVLPDHDAGTAPLVPPTFGGTAKAGAPNTLYAHVWNLGRAPAYRVRVEFYWFDPSLGISRSDAHLVGATWVDLADRFTLYPGWRQVTSPYGSRYATRGCHAIVRCPETWVPTFVNHGHECLVVRAFEPMMDSLPYAQFSARADRHVGQRNIAVVTSSSPAAIDLALALGWAEAPDEATVEATVEPPDSMEWLRLYTGRRDPGLTEPAAPHLVGLTPPATVGARITEVGKLPFDCRGPLLRSRERFHRGCDPLRIGLHASVRDLKPGEARVVRVRQRLEGEDIGGYSVVLIGA